MLGVLACFTSCAPKLRMIEFVKMEKTDVKTQGANLKWEGNAVFNNPNGFGVRLKKTEVFAFMGNDTIAQVMPEKSIKIKRKREFRIPLTVDLNLGNKNTINGILNVIQKKDTDVDIKGYIIISKWPFKKKLPIDAKIPIKM